jgi:hypothetical protein
VLEECASQPERRATFPDTKADLQAIRERIEKGWSDGVHDAVEKLL